MARRTKLTPARQSDIIQALEAGNYFDASCEYAGVTATTGYNWKVRGREEKARRENPRVKEGTEQWEREQSFVEFFEAVSRASANVEIRTIASIQKSGVGIAAKFDNDGKETQPAIPPDWRALTWFMEHRYPTKWGKQYSESKQELTGKDGGAIEQRITKVVKAEDLTDDELATLAAGIASKRDSGATS